MEDYFLEFNFLCFILTKTHYSCLCFLSLINIVCVGALAWLADCLPNYRNIHHTYIMGQDNFFSKREKCKRILFMKYLIWIICVLLTYKQNFQVQNTRLSRTRFNFSHSFIYLLKLWTISSILVTPDSVQGAKERAGARVILVPIQMGHAILLTGRHKVPWRKKKWKLI